MGLFIAIALLSIAVSILVARPLLLGGVGTENDVTGTEIFHDQLRQLEIDRKEGLINDKDATSARAEIARRLLALEETNARIGTSVIVGRPAITLGLIIALGLPLASGAIYLNIGRPDLPAQPLVSRPDNGMRPDAETAIAATEQHDDELEDLVIQLEARLEDNPDDIDGWALLARSYITQGRIQKASEAYGKAIELTGGTEPLLRGEQAELLTILNGGVVVPEAEAGFNAVLAQDADEPRARFYLALAKAQQGDMEAAMTDWATLLNSAGPNEAWVEPVSQRVFAMAGDNGIDPADYGIKPPAAPLSVPPSTPSSTPSSTPRTSQAPAGDAPRGPTQEQVAAASNMSETDQQAMISTMVAGLRERLDRGEGGIDGWKRLARAYGVLDKPEEQLYAYRKARDLAPDDVETQLALANALMDIENGLINAETEAALIRVLKLDPDNPDALWNLGRAAADTGNAARARDYWTTLLAVISQDEGARTMVQEAIDGLGS